MNLSVKNDKDLKWAEEWLAKFTAAHGSIRDTIKNNPALLELIIQAYDSIIEELTENIWRYKNLPRGLQKQKED